MSPTSSIVAYLALFAIVGFLFLFTSLLIGRLLRPRLPTPEKREIYECGEPTIGSSFVQFNLRFYVVALLFLIFDVEVAFFFPWATVFGKSTQLMDLNGRIVAADDTKDAADLHRAATRKYDELGVDHPQLHPDIKENARLNRTDAGKLALASMADISVFFAVLLVGFAYVWRRGDLDWVRAMPRRSSDAVEPVYPGLTAGPRTQ